MDWNGQLRQEIGGHFVNQSKMKAVNIIQSEITLFYLTKSYCFNEIKKDFLKVKEEYLEAFSNGGRWRG